MVTIVDITIIAQFDHIASLTLFYERVFVSLDNPALTTKLNIPRKTKLFVDQALRERENATSTCLFLVLFLYLTAYI